jgi:hypothetical protein
VAAGAIEQPPTLDAVSIPLLTALGPPFFLAMLEWGYADCLQMWSFSSGIDFQACTKQHVNLPGASFTKGRWVF